MLICHCHCTQVCMFLIIIQVFIAIFFKLIDLFLIDDFKFFDFIDKVYDDLLHCVSWGLFTLFSLESIYISCYLWLCGVTWPCGHFCVLSVLSEVFDCLCWVEVCFLLLLLLSTSDWFEESSRFQCSSKQENI